MKNYTLLVVLLLTFTTLWSQNDKKLIIGKVFNENNAPFSDVNLDIKGTTTKTNKDGKFKINARAIDTIVFSFSGYFNKKVVVGESSEIFVRMVLNPAIEDGLIDVSLGMQKDKDAISTAYTDLDANNLVIGTKGNTVESLQGKVSGLNIHNNEVYLRGIRTIRGNNSALIVIDGVVSTYEHFESLESNFIESVTIHKGPNGAALYGSQGSNGVVVVKTRKSFSEGGVKAGTFNSNTAFTDNKYREKLKVNYEVSNAKNNILKGENAYEIYSSQKDTYANQDDYHINAYNYFLKSNQEDNCKKVLNTVINSETTNTSLLKALAYRLEELGKFSEASVLYNKVLKESPNDVKSYRDISLVYSDLNKNQVSLNTLSIFFGPDLEDSENDVAANNFKNITRHEVNNIIQKSTELNTSNLAGHNIIKTEYDLRIVIDWNQDTVNLNTKVVDPNLEICSSNFPTTKIGGEFSAVDGLNEYVLRNGRTGDYYIIVNNSETNADEVTYVKVTIFKNYGRSNETKEINVYKLEKHNEDQVLYNVKI